MEDREKVLQELEQSIGAYLGALEKWQDAVETRIKNLELFGCKGNVEKMEKVKLYNGEVELIFDPATHTYTANGEIVFGVTSVVGVLDKPALVYWSANMGAGFADKVLVPGMIIDEINKPAIISGIKTAFRKKSSEAADIGTAVHAYLESYLKAGINKETLPDLPVNPLIRSAFEAFKTWTKDNNVKFIDSERKIYSREHQYAGTLDALAEVNGKLAIVDFKTSSGIYDDMLIQTSAYAKAIEEEDQKPIEECWILRIPKDGSEFETRKDDMVDMNFKSFLGCLENYRRKMYLKGVEIESKKIKLKKIMETV